MTDLGEIVGRDKFYNALKAGDKAAKARGTTRYVFTRHKLQPGLQCLIRVDLKVEI